MARVCESTRLEGNAERSLSNIKKKEDRNNYLMISKAVKWMMKRTPVYQDAQRRKQESEKKEEQLLASIKELESKIRDVEDK